MSAGVGRSNRLSLLHPSASTDAAIAVLASQPCTLRAFRSTETASTSCTFSSSLPPPSLPPRRLSLKRDTIIPVKSKFGAEFRRFSVLVVAGEETPAFTRFEEEIFQLHNLSSPALRDGISIEYADPEGDGHLPINNDETLFVALCSRPQLLRVFVQRRGESLSAVFGYGASRRSIDRRRRVRPAISAPQDFRRVSAIVDVDILPLELRRVQLCKFQSNMPLGFYIRDGISFRQSPYGGPPFPAPGVFISRLVDNGLAASTNLLHPNDEILEVNGIDVTGKTLDQVTDIMIANSYNLILTVRPAPPPEHVRAGFQFPPGLSPPPSYSASGTLASRSSRVFESGLRSYMDTPTYGTLPIRGGGSGENWSAPVSAASCHALPSACRRPITAWSPSFSRNTTVRLSDKLKNERAAPSPGEMRRLRRPFSLYAPNL